MKLLIFCRRAKELASRALHGWYEKRLTVEDLLAEADGGRFTWIGAGGAAVECCAAGPGLSRQHRKHFLHHVCGDLCEETRRHGVPKKEIVTSIQQYDATAYGNKEKHQYRLEKTLAAVYDQNGDQIGDASWKGKKAKVEADDIYYSLFRAVHAPKAE